MNKMPGLDLLRGIAIAWVMLFHSFIVGGLGDHFEWLSRFGWMGVDLFFVLSGFLIGTQVLRPLSRGEELSFGAFYLRRAFRILPAFAVVVFLYTLVPALREAPGMEPWWKFAGFFVNLDIDYSTNQAFSHAWSLCVEEHFYLLFPLIAWALMRRPSARKVLLVAAGIVIAGIALRSAIWLHNSAIEQNRNWFVEDLYYPTWTRLDGLLAGVMLAVLNVFRPELWGRFGRHANKLLLAGLTVVGLAFLLFANRTGLLGNSIGWPVLSFGLALLVCAGSHQSSWIGRRHLPAMGWLATISYSLYLTHKLTFHVVSVALGDGSAIPGFFAFLIYAFASLFVGAVLYYAVERPFLSWRDRLSKPRPANEAMAQVA
jgi:peptidoglycan/LPS O-acetylase OafA/YrhL